MEGFAPAISRPLTTYPLNKRRILLTCTTRKANTLSARITQLGGKALLFPLLNIAALPNIHALQQAAAQLNRYDLVVFVSPNAVEFGLPTLLAAQPWTQRLTAAAVGLGTAAALHAAGLAPVIVPDQHFDSEGLLAHPCLQTQQISGKNVLIVRGNGGRELLAQSLRERGAHVDCVACYQRTKPCHKAFLSAIKHERLDGITVFSSESLSNLLSLLDKISALPHLEGEQPASDLLTLPLFTPHRRIAECASRLNWRSVILSQASDDDLINTLCEYSWLPNE